MPAEAIIQKWLSGQASPEEAAMIEAWASANPGNKQVLDKLWQDYHRITAETPASIPDPKMEWQRLREKINPGPPPAPGPATKPGPVPAPASPPAKAGWTAGRWALIVSTAAVIAISTWLLIKQRSQSSGTNITTTNPTGTGNPPNQSPNGPTGSNPAAQTIIQGQDTVSRLTLPGEIHVTLDEQSTLCYPAADKQPANFSVRGQAVFQAGTTSHSYQVQAGSLTIQVAGNNSFYIATDSAAGTTTIQALQGQLTLSDGQRQYSLPEGKGLKYMETSHQADTNYQPDLNAWGFATRVFKFRDAPLKDVLDRLSKAYGVRFSTGNNALLNCRITTQFDNESLSYILEVLAETLTIQYEFRNHGKQVFISGNGCN